MAPTQRIPITIITGFLGSGKTTLILNLIPQLPKDYRLALLKNEFGDVAVDSQLASSSAISGVQELLNGCICCNLVGQLSDALTTLHTTIHPDRIIIETSGSAFPATLAMEINRLSHSTGLYTLDGVLSVIDVENWAGYDDTSYTAKLQARYTDLIVLNKWEDAGERRLEECEDRILDLELEVPTPRVRSRRGWVGREVVFGLDARLAGEGVGVDGAVVEEDGHGGHQHDHQSEVEVLSVTLDSERSSNAGVDLEKLHALLNEAPKDEIYRIKGVLFASSVPKSSTGEPAVGSENLPASSRPAKYILNWAFQRWTFTALVPDPPRVDSGVSTPISDEPALRMTIVTARSESSKWKKRIEIGEFVALEKGAADAVLKVERVS